MQIALGILEDNESGSSFSRSTILTLEEYRDIKNALKDIFDFNQTIELFQILLLNEKSINDFIDVSQQEIINKSNRWNGFSNSDREELKIDLNRNLLNYLSSARMYIDHAKTFLTRKFGDKSNQFIKYKETCSKVYDNSFAYRFFYKLRDYIQHCGLPFETFGFHLKPIENKVVLDISFDRDSLLENFGSSWKSTVKSDLGKQEKKINFLPLLNTNTDNLKEIHNTHKAIIVESINQSVQYLNNLTRQLKTDTNKVCIFSDVETFDNGLLKNKEILIEEIPLSILDIILKEMG